MEKPSIPKSNWNGQLPPHVAKNVEIWWDIFPNIKPSLPPKFFQLFGGAKLLPSRQVMGKVVLVVETREELRRQNTLWPTLLNDWGCYCYERFDDNKSKDYCAGATELGLDFMVSSPFMFKLVKSKFGIVASPVEALDPQTKEKLLMQIESGQRLQEQLYPNSYEVKVVTFKPGLWEAGLDMSFKAALWLSSNVEEALANIWPYLKDTSLKDISKASDNPP